MPLENANKDTKMCPVERERERERERAEMLETLELLSVCGGAWSSGKCPPDSSSLQNTSSSQLAAA